MATSRRHFIENMPKLDIFLMGLTQITMIDFL